MGRSIWGLLGIVLLLIGAMAAKERLIALPAPPAHAAPGQFDASRAVARLAFVLGDERPHPVDSANGDAVRDRLIQAMRGVGLAPRISDDFACNGFARSRAVSCARVRNLVAEIGPASGPALLLAAHYDSATAGPGAADDGIGVATMLEIAANLRGRPLSRGVIFLIDEGEEAGLIGARAFLDRDPAAARVDAVLNMEARGVSGPAIMFETSRPNAAAVALYRAAATRPLANSLSADLYGLIPNSTDVNVFKARPWTILNFAIIGNETRYHSPGDRVEALDRASLQHMGDQVQGATDAVLASGVPAARGTRLYAELAGRALIVLPAGFGLLLLGLLLLFFALTSWRRGALGRPLGAVAASLAAGAGLAWLGSFAIGLVRAGDYWRASPVVTTSAVYASAIVAALLAIRAIAPEAGRQRLRAAFWLAFTIVGAAISLVAPGGAIYFLLPPLIAALGIALGRGRPAIETGAALVAALALYVSFGPALGLFEVLLTDGPFWVFAPLGALMLLPWLIELPLLVERCRPLALPGAALLLIAWTAVALTPAYSEDRQQRMTVAYLRDGGTGAARWTLSGDGARRPPGFDWRREALPWSPAKRWTADAPRDADGGAAAPTLERIGEARTGGVRRIRVRLHAPGADQLALFAPAGSPLIAAGAPGFIQPFGRGDPGDPFVLGCAGRSCDGATFDILLRGTAPAPATLVATRFGLDDPRRPARPPLARPQYAPDSRIVFTRLRL